MALLSDYCGYSGPPGAICTHDPCLRRAVLYPAELRAENCGFYPVRRAPSNPSRSSVEKAAGGVVALRVIAVAQVVDANPAVGRRGMDEAQIADVDPDMRIGAAAGVEEDQVA